MQYSIRQYYVFPLWRVFSGLMFDFLFVDIWTQFGMFALFDFDGTQNGSVGSFFKKWAIPGLFLFIFVFSIQMIVNK